MPVSPTAHRRFQADTGNALHMDFNRSLKGAQLSASMRPSSAIVSGIQKLETGQAVPSSFFRQAVLQTESNAHSLLQDQNRQHQSDVSLREINGRFSRTDDNGVAFYLHALSGAESSTRQAFLKAFLHISSENQKKIMAVLDADASLVRDLLEDVNVRVALAGKSYGSLEQDKRLLDTAFSRLDEVGVKMYLSFIVEGNDHIRQNFIGDLLGLSSGNEKKVMDVLEKNPSLRERLWKGEEHMQILFEDIHGSIDLS